MHKKQWRGSHQVTSIVHSSLVKIVLELSSGIFMMSLRKGSKSSNSEDSLASATSTTTTTTTTTPGSTSTSADQSVSNIRSKHRQEEVRAEVTALVRRVVPEEADNIDERCHSSKDERKNSLRNCDVCRNVLLQEEHDVLFKW